MKTSESPKAYILTEYQLDLFDRENRHHQHELEEKKEALRRLARVLGIKICILE